MSLRPGEQLLLTPKEVAELCGWSRSYVYQLMNQGVLAVVRVGRAPRVPRSWLENWINGQVESWEEARKHA